MPNTGSAERVALRAAMGFYLRSSAQIASSLGGGDMMRGLIVVGLNHANVAHIPPESDRFTTVDRPVPLEERRPISVHALSLQLGTPYETTRRHVKALIDEGICKRVGNGVVILPHTIDNVAVRLRANLENVQAFLSDLRRGGLLTANENA
jgi:hypothetical protein